MVICIKHIYQILMEITVILIAKFGISLFLKIISDLIFPKHAPMTVIVMVKENVLMENVLVLQEILMILVTIILLTLNVSILITNTL